MKVLVTGGSGFVGSLLCQRLAEAGHDVTSFDVRPSRGDHRWLVGSLTDPADVVGAVRGSEVVFHLGGVSNTRKAFEGPLKMMEANVAGTQFVLEAAGHGEAYVVLAGSSLVTGALVPYEMWWPPSRHAELVGGLLDGWVVDEGSALDLRTPVHPYVASKLWVEMIAQSYWKSYGVPTLTFRYGIMYGPNMAPGVLADLFIKRGLAGEPLIIEGSGHQWRQYLHVEDLVRAHVDVCDAAKLEDLAGETIALVPEEKTSVIRMAKAVQKATHRATVPQSSIEMVGPRPDDIQVRFHLASKAKERLGWRTEIGLEEGIASVVEEYRADRR